MTKLTKKEIQKRVLKNGKPLPLNDFEWDGKTKTFSSNINGLVLDFNGIGGVTFKTLSNCTFDTFSNCIFNTGSYCTFNDIKENCVIIRRDKFEVIQPNIGDNIQLNPYDIKGYKTIKPKEEITCNGKIVEIDGKKYKLEEV